MVLGDDCGADGPLAASVDLSHTGSWTFHRLFTAGFPQPVSGTHDLFLRFVNPHANPGEMFRLKRFSIFRTPPKALPASPLARTRAASHVIDGRYAVARLRTQDDAIAGSAGISNFEAYVFFYAAMAS